MGTLVTLGIVALILVVLGLIPLGIDAAYAGGVFSLAVRVGFISVRLGGGGEKAPKKNKTPKKEKPAKKQSRRKADEPEKPKRKLPPWPVIKLLLKNGCSTLLWFVRRVRIGLLRAHLTAAGGPDPAAGAMEYGAAALAMETLSRIGGRRIRRTELRADVDFEADAPVIDLRVVLTVNLFLIFGAAARFGVGFLTDYVRYKKLDKGEENGNGKTDRRPHGRGDG